MSRPGAEQPGESVIAEAVSETADLEDAREKLIQSFGNLPDADLDEPGVVGDWSVRECLAHILVWDRWGVETLAALERGEATSAPDEATVNQSACRACPPYSVQEFVRELRGLRKNLIDGLAVMTDEERSEPRYEMDGRQISADDFIDGFIEHDLEHASGIRAWRKAKGHC
ncbi:MAG: DinB family protein [Dehalococcoidia bacterium]